MSAWTWAPPSRFFRWVFVAFFAVIGLGIVASAVVFALRPESGFVPFPFGWFWFIVLLLFLFFFKFRFLGGWGWYGRPYWYNRGEGAKEIVRERYARGEIGKDQFDEMMRDLDQRP